MKWIAFLMLISVGCTAADEKGTYQLELQAYEMAIAKCEVDSMQPLNPDGYSPRFGHESYRTALLYFKLLTDYQCVEPELNLLHSRLQSVAVYELSSVKESEIKNILWLITDEKERLANAMSKFEAIADSEKKSLWKIEAAKRPFNVTDALRLYTDIPL